MYDVKLTVTQIDAILGGFDENEKFTEAFTDLCQRLIEKRHTALEIGQNDMAETRGECRMLRKFLALRDDLAAERRLLPGK